jgi:hypothetical protein
VPTTSARTEPVVCVQRGQQALELRQLRKIVDDDVAIGGVHDQKILVVLLSRIERIESIDSRHEWPGEDVIPAARGIKARSEWSPVAVAMD